MPTIAQGSSADITVSADSTLTVQNPGGYCKVENPIGTVIREGGAASWPVDVTAGSVRITAVTGGVWYELTADPRAGQAVQVEAHRSGAGVVLSAGSTLLAPQFNALSGKTMALFGNSIAKQNAVGYSVAGKFDYHGHVHWANAFLGAPMRWSTYGGRGGVGSDPTGTGQAQLNNGVFGWSGATTTQLDAYFDGFCDASGADFVFIHALENDLLAGAGSAAVACANVMRWVSYAVRAGKYPVVIGPLPSTSFNTSTMGVEYWTLDRMLADLAKLNRFFCYVPCGDLYTDTTAAGAQPLLTGSFAGYTDGTIHPRRASILIGDRIASALEASGFVGWPSLPGGAATGSSAPNVVGRNTGLIGTAGTATAPATGSVATWMTINATTMTSCLCSKIVRTGREWQKVVASYAGVAAQHGNNFYGQYETTNWAVGDYVQVFADIEFDPSVAFANWQGTQIQLQQSGGTGDGYGFSIGTADAAIALWPAGRVARMYSPEMAVSVGTTSIRGLILNRTGPSVTAADWTWMLGYNGIINLSR